jgi:hypothetical protein
MLTNKQRHKSAKATHRIDDLGEGVPLPGWFSDAGWKRMRGQYLSNSG